MRSGRSLAVRDEARCRMHGGAKGSGAPKGNKNALKHGRYTAKAQAERKGLSALLREARSVLVELRKTD